MKKAILSLSVVLGLMTSDALAQEKSNLGFKSETTALLLGLDPIPGDALFYAGKPIQASINILMGLPGAVSFVFGLAMLADANNCNEPEDCQAVGAGFAVGGALLYVPMLIWDAAGGIGGVREHNERLQEKHSLLQRVQPTVAVTNDGAIGGVRIKF